MKIGDIVQNGRHVGVLVEINSNGICKISSSNVNSIATLNNLRFIRSAEESKFLQKELEEEAKRKVQEQLLRQEKEKSLQKERENESKRLQLYQENLRRETESKRDKLFAEIQKYLESDFLKVEKFYHNFCADIIKKDEFKKELENHLILKLKHSVIEADNLFFNQKTISKSEYEHLKNNEVRNFLQNLHIPLNDEQINAIGVVDKNILLKARAGSGKTSL